ncbi:unnamed protein product, partial [Discosporangium mesarthrocarpum]
TFGDVLKSEYSNVWEDAMADEFNGLLSVGAFSLATPPSDRKPIGAKWVFKWKSDEWGKVTRAKARLVAKGYSQKAEVVYRVLDQAHAGSCQESLESWFEGVEVSQEDTRLGTTFQKTGTMQLYAYADSSYAGDEGDRRSVSGGAVIYCLVSRTQKVVALSSTEAEYMAFGECAKELLFFSNVLRFIHPLVGHSPLVLFEDNMGAINLAESPSSSASKHIDVQHHL